MLNAQIKSDYSEMKGDNISLVSKYWSIFIKILSEIRGIISLISKIIFIIASLYYCINYKLYSITIYIPEFLRLGIINKLVSNVESLGLIIMIIPMTIVMTSFFSKSNILKVISLFISISGNIFTFFYALSSGLLEERFKVGFLTIYNNISQRDKEKAFQILFDEKINLFSNKVVNIIDFERYVQSFVSKNWLNYLDKLKDLTMDKLEPYVSHIVKGIYNSYNEQINEIVNTNNNGIWYILSHNIGKIVTFTLVSTIIGYIFYSFFMKKMKEAGTLIKDSAVEMQNINENQQLIAQQAAETNTILQNNITQLDLTSDNIQSIINNIKRIDTRLIEYGHEINVHGQHISQGANEIRQLKESLDILANSVLRDLSEFSEINIKNNIIQNELNHKLNQIKADCMAAIDQLNIRFEGLTNLSTSPNMRNANIDPELVLTAAMQREYQSAMNKIKDLNVSEVINNIKTDLMRIIAMNNAENQTEIVNLITRSNGIEAKLDNVKKLSITTSKKTNAIQESMSNSEKNIKENALLLDKVVKEQNMDKATIHNLHKTQIENKNNINTLIKNQIEDNQQLHTLNDKVSAQEDQETFILNSNVELENKINTVDSNVKQLRSEFITFKQEISENINKLTTYISDTKRDIISHIIPNSGIVTSAITMIRGINEDNRNISTQQNASRDFDPERARDLATRVGISFSINNNNTTQSDFEAIKEKQRQEYTPDEQIRLTALFLSEKNGTTIEYEEQILRNAREEILFGHGVD